MSRRPRNPQTPPPSTPFDAVQDAADREIAADLGRVMEAIAPYNANTVAGKLWKKPTGGVGSFEFIDNVYLPFDFDAIMVQLRDDYGPGDYELRVFAGGRQRAVAPFKIARTTSFGKAPAGEPGARAPNTGFGMMEFLLAQMAEDRRDARARDERQAAEARASADRQATLLAGAATALAPVLQAMLGRPAGGGAAETVALIQALRPEGGGMKETVETLAAFKTLMGPVEAGEGGDGIRVDPDDLVASGARLIGPTIKALGDLVASRREGGATSASGAGSPGEPVPLALGAPASRFPVIDLVRPHVVFFFEHDLDAQKCADVVYDVILAHSVTAGEIDAVAAAFALSPTGLDDLAREGIDLRSRPGWAAEFFAELHAIHTDQENDIGGGDGGASDAPADGATRAGGAT